MNSTHYAWIAREEHVQQLVIDAAHALGYRVAHFRAAQTANGWRTPVQADGEGFPDLVITGHHRVIYVECKSQRGKLRPAQREWLARLRDAHQTVWLVRPVSYNHGSHDVEEIGVDEAIRRLARYAGHAPASHDTGQPTVFNGEQHLPWDDAIPRSLAERIAATGIAPTFDGMLDAIAGFGWLLYVAASGFGKPVTATIRDQHGRRIASGEGDRETLAVARALDAALDDPRTILEM